MHSQPSDNDKGHAELADSVRAESAAGTSATAHLAAVVPEHLLDDGELVILAVKPSMWFIVFYSAKLIVVVLAAMILLRFSPLGDHLADWHVHQIAAVLMLLQVMIAFLHWLSRLYVLTNRRVMRIKGIFTINVFEAALTRIQNTYLTLAIHERLLGLGSIQFMTAGTAGVEAAWYNVNNPLDVHELIRRTIRQAKQHLPNNNGL